MRIIEKLNKALDDMSHKVTNNLTKAQIKNRIRACKISIASLSTILAVCVGMTIGYKIAEGVNEEPTEIITESPTETATEGVAEKPYEEKVYATIDMTPEEAYQALRKACAQTIPTEVKHYADTDKFHATAEAQDVLKVSTELSVAVENYFRACGATYWTNQDTKQFWPEDIEYIVTAIAFCESSYRTDTVNEFGFKGIAGVDDDTILKTLKEQWLVEHIWGDTIPQINCNINEVDVFNPVTCLEYTYYNLGYNLSNVIKKGTYFKDTAHDGLYKSIWNKLGEYDEELQIRLLIASHRFGINNVIKSVYGRNYNEKEKRYISLDEYIYGGYVNAVLDKTYELKNLYESSLER